MSHLLKENDIVHCESQEQYDRIIELAKKAGIEVYCETDKERHWDRFHNLARGQRGRAAAPRLQP
jgi:hypothetical protein